MIIKNLPLFSMVKSKIIPHVTLALLIVIPLLTVNVVSAQEGEVVIQQDKRIDDLIDRYVEVHSKTDFYQIQVGILGDHDKAQQLIDEVKLDFPGWYSKIEFISPTYRVRLGKFRTKLVAERKYKEVRGKYPAAQLLRPKRKTKKRTSSPTKE